MLPATGAPSPVRGQRSMAGYLLMPRPKDLVKGLLIPVTYVLGLLSTGDVTGQSLLRAGVVVIAVELLIYPARYQWNDIRGFAADQQHPSAKDRGRLPGPLSCARSRVLASGIVIAVRLTMVGLLVVLLPGLHLGPILGFAAVGIFGVAIVYEVLRSVSTGRTGEIPAPLNAGIVLLWLIAGAGYVVRGMTGLALAVELPERPLLAAAAAVTLWAYGIAFVTSRWALEATAFASCRDGWVVWQARAGQAREHLLALVRWLPSRMEERSTDVKEWAPLRGPTSPGAPWNVAMVVAGSAAALTGRLLCGPCPPAQGMIMATLGAVIAAAVTAGRRRKTLTALGASALMGALTVMEPPRHVLGVLPWLLLLAAYLFFSTRTLGRLGRRNALSAAAEEVGSAVWRLIVGRPTWDAMTAYRDASTTDRPG
jgi:hypothetical protein